jgi:hypothetical protein
MGDEVRGSSGGNILSSVINPFSSAKKEDEKCES